MHRRSVSSPSAAQAAPAYWGKICERAAELVDLKGLLDKSVTSLQELARSEEHKAGKPAIQAALADVVLDVHLAGESAEELLAATRPVPTNHGEISIYPVKIHAPLEALAKASKALLTALKHQRGRPAALKRYRSAVEWYGEQLDELKQYVTQAADEWQWPVDSALQVASTFDPKKPNRKPGRPVKYDPKRDKDIVAAVDSGKYRNRAHVAAAFGIDLAELKRAQGRVRDRKLKRNRKRKRRESVRSKS